MGRIRTETKVDGRTLWTLFDSGAKNTYVARNAIESLPVDIKTLPQPQMTKLGGRVHQVNEGCYLFAEIEGHPVQMVARVIDEIGQDDGGRPIELLFGALDMQQWGIRLDLPNEKIDWSLYSTTFVEF